ncbi:hypothetical protein Tco_1090672 [Tanacetum coccineum]|uniref:Uncharacterized protein n=1 Tax=Tanacetum coccineum TaxID=301880 RepID=A0ABQ5I4X8_9ASTR
MISKAQQIKLENALVAPENRHVIGKCNMRINPGMKPKEPTYQVALDALALTTCYPTFLITVEVPVIYMHHVQEFNKPLTEKEALSFICELGHSREIKYITDVIIDHLHQPWRTFASIINKCLCGKVSGLDNIRLSIIDNIDSKKQDKMLYPRFTKIIIHYFLDKDKSISMRNRTFMHTARDDSLLVKEKSKETISSEESPSMKKSAKAKKVAATKPKPTKKKAPVKTDKGKGFNVLSEVALSEAAQLKEVAKRSKKYFDISYASGSGEGTDFELGVPDEQHRKTSGTDEGTGTKPGVSDVPKYDSESEKESWGDSGEEDDDDEENMDEE